MRYLSERIRLRLYRSDVRKETIEAIDRYVKKEGIRVSDVSILTKCISTVFEKQYSCVDVEIVKKDGTIVRKPFFESEDKTYSFEELATQPDY